MNCLSYYIRSLPDWCACLDDAEVQTRWRALARSEEYLPKHFHFRNRMEDDMSDLSTTPPLAENQIDWVLGELPHYARRISEKCQACPTPSYKFIRVLIYTDNFPPPAIVFRTHFRIRRALAIFPPLTRTHRDLSPLSIRSICSTSTSPARHAGRDGSSNDLIGPRSPLHLPHHLRSYASNRRRAGRSTENR